MAREPEWNKRAIADVLENVLPVDERRPCRSRARLRRPCASGKRCRAWGPTHRHGVAADAAAGDLPFQQKRGAVMRAAGAERRGARSHEQRNARRPGSARRASRGDCAPEHRIKPSRFCPDRVRPIGGKCDLPENHRARRQDRKVSREAAVPGSCAFLRPPEWFRGPARNPE